MLNEVSLCFKKFIGIIDPGRSGEPGAGSKRERKGGDRKDYDEDCEPAPAATDADGDEEDHEPAKDKHFHQLVGQDSSEPAPNSIGGHRRL